jgi:hypothetical protein
MELGNAIFGNSRGEHPVDRNLQDEFCKMLEWLGWEPYDESTIQKGDFTIRPYYWGDCTCGWEEIESDLLLHHQLECYQTKLNELKRRKGPPYNNPVYSKYRTELCLQMGLDPERGCEVHCTCDYDERYKAWFEAHKLGDDGHKDSCPIVLPNFECKSLGFTLKWYKYPLRDSYSNIPLTTELLAQMVSLATRLPKAEPRDIQEGWS